MNETIWIDRKSHAQWLEARKDAVNSTEIASLCGIVKYDITPFSLFHRKIGTIADDWVAGGRTEVGIVMEHGISRLAARRLKVKVRKLAAYARRGDLGASFDYEIVGGEYDGWLVEIKNVDYLIFRDEWSKDHAGQPVAPEHILLQTQCQLEVSRRPGTFLCALVGGNDLKIVRIGRDEEIGAAMQKIASDFMARVRARGPEPEVVAGDSAWVKALYPTDDGSVLDASENAHLCALISEFSALKQAEKEAKERADEVKAEALLLAKGAKVVLTPQFKVDSGTTKDSMGTLITSEMVGGYVGARAGFRRFVVKERK